MSLSTHKVEVFQIESIEPHPNADKLEIIRPWGYSCCVVKGQYAAGGLAAYIPPDSLIYTSRPEFAFLAKDGKTQHRIKCIKLRGVQSFGLIVPAPPGSKAGDDVTEFYGVQHYDPPGEDDADVKVPRKKTLWRWIKTWIWWLLRWFLPARFAPQQQSGKLDRVPARLSALSKYDVDSLRRYAHVFNEGEMVLVTEKLHGQSARYCYIDGQMYCGSRNQWKRESPTENVWKALQATPQIREFCMAHPGIVLYGEVYGWVQDLRYGAKPGEVWFAAFDVLLIDGTWMSAQSGRALCTGWNVPVVPFVAEMPYNFDAVCKLSDGSSLIPGAGHLREGVVIKPLCERFHADVGRVQLKVVSGAYLERA